MRLPARVQSDRRLVDATLRRFLPKPGSVPVTVRRAISHTYQLGTALESAIGSSKCQAIRSRMSAARGCTTNSW